MVESSRHTVFVRAHVRGATAVIAKIHFTNDESYTIQVLDTSTWENLAHCRPYLISHDGGSFYNPHADEGLFERSPWPHMTDCQRRLGHLTMSILDEIAGGTN